MKRDYISGTSDAVTFFVGTEIEHTPAYNMKTLFVVGVHDSATILHLADDTQSLLDESKRIKHIYFGANQSFSTNGVNDIETWRPWEDMIKGCLEAGYWCTLDFDVKETEGLHESGLCEYRRFIPQISVKLPYMSLLNYNATIKFDDKDFDATNPGVWCVPLGAVTQKKYFTNWDLYTNDEIIL
jgi:hypothetical protein